MRKSNQDLEFRTITDILRWRAIDQRDSVACTFLLDGEDKSRSLTYGELDLQARATAGLLQTRLKAGERALMLYPSGLEFIAGFFGCLYAGVVAVPAYPPRGNRNMSRLLAIVEDADASIILSTSSTIDAMSAHLPAEQAVLPTDTVSAEMASGWHQFTPSIDNLAFLQYTSGSTGKPKGVMVSHGNLLHNQKTIERSFGCSEQSVCVSWLPLFHDMGLIGNLLHPLYLGFPSILMSPTAFLQKPFRWLKAISRYKGTLSGGPNFAYDLCAESISSEQTKSLDLGSWNVAYNGSEPVRAGTLERFVNAFEASGFRRESFYPCYGMAEATLMVTGGKNAPTPVVQGLDATVFEQNKIVAGHTQRHTLNLIGSGRACTDVKVIIVDPKTRVECPPGQVGEIWTSSSSVARGYWKNPVATEQTFRACLADTGEGPFLRTGDLGFMRNDELFVTGRHKDLIIIHGRNYYPQDIEMTVEQSHPALRQGNGAAFSIEAEGEERLVIVQEVERSAMRKLDADEVICAVRCAISELNELQVYAVLLLKTGTIPKTSSGKIQRHACKAGFLAGNLNTVEKWRQNPINKAEYVERHYDKQASVYKNVRDIEVWLAAKIANRLNLAPEIIDIRKPFAQYGLDSIAVVRLSGELGEWLERDVSPTLAYDYPTIESLSRYLAGHPEPGKTPMAVSGGFGSQRAPIAVVGLGCRFPGAKNPRAFWQLLREGVDAITEVPSDRWEADAFYDSTPGISGKMNSRWGGFIEDVDKFEPEFFGISPREAQAMDPQQRLLLEVAWEALEHAGQAPDELARSKTGVFIGISNNDYARLQLNHPSEATAYAGTGNAFSIAANRLSYYFDLRGPSLVVDTACSSSLVSVHHACQSLRLGECDMALAGGVNLILSPALSIVFSQARMLAADGRCKTFDDSADGYVRGEGCGIVVLKRLLDAVRDGNRILASIRGSAINSDGRTNGLTAPNGESQREVISDALRNADIAAHQIDYVEAHGSGTSLGDPIEFNTLTSVLRESRAREKYCFIGSVKTNIGHLEAAAGVAGLIKLVLSLQHREIPPNLHFSKLNSHITLANSPFSIPVQCRQWPGANGSRIGAVSAFGFGGTNTHMIVEEAPALSQAPAFVDRPMHLLVLSARSEAGLRDLADRYARFLGEHPALDIGNACHTAAIGRSHFEHRLAVRAGSITGMQERLQAVASGAQINGVVIGHAAYHKRPKRAFLFNGLAVQYIGVGRELYETQRTFRNAFERCHELLKADLKISLHEMLYAAPDSNSPLNKTTYLQPLLFALEYALAELWQSWGIKPDAVIGHGPGEYVAACVVGIFTLEDGLKMVAGFESEARNITYSSPALPMVSAVTGTLIGDEIATAEYWCDRHRPRAPVTESTARLQQLGFNIFLEVGPNPALSSVARECLSSDDSLWLASLCEGVSGWQQMLESLAVLYVRGVAIDWHGFDRDYVRQRVELPTYPFRRQRYWLAGDQSEFQGNSHSDSASGEPLQESLQESLQNMLYDVEWIVKDSDSSQSSTGFIPDLPELETLLRQACQQITSSSTIENYTQTIDKMETLCVDYIGTAFNEMGWRFEKGHVFEIDDMIKALGIEHRYRKLLNRLLNILMEDGVLGYKGGFWKVISIPEFQNPTEQNTLLSNSHNIAIHELALLDLCGSNLAHILQGKCDPLQLLFPQGDPESLTRLYQDSPGTTVMNTLMREAVIEALADLPSDRVVRILEIGGGTGGTTSYLLPALSACPIEYTFTDISPVFLNWAERRFSKYPFVRYRVLDIEQAPAGQAFDLHGYDMIVAANVLHATEYLKQTLNHIRQLLKPGGMMLLFEGTAPQRWLDLIFGLTEGWWRFSDHELRPDYPLLPENRWKTLLAESGFEQIVAVSPDQESHGALSRQSVILAKTGRSEPVSDSMGWLIFSDKPDAAKALAQLAVSRAEHCTIVYSGDACQQLSYQQLSYQQLSYQQLSEQEYRVDLTSPENTERLFNEYRHQVSGVLQHRIVYLSGMDVDDPERLTADELERICENSGAGFLHVCQALIRSKLPASLWVVTQTAQATGQESRLPGVVHATLWGMAKVAALEHPDLSCVRIDLDDDPVNSTNHLYREICSGAHEDQVAFRRGTRYVPRLVKHRYPVAPPKPVAIQGEGSYLIAGGLGDLGLLVAGWLVEHGARSIVLTGRGGASQAARRQISELADRGIVVRIFQADISDMTQMERVFATVNKTLPSLRGVIHAAGTLDDGLIQQQSWGQFANVFRPKVNGAWNLHRLTREMALDFFILFSSAAALLGSPGQAAHAAANSFLDTLVHYRRMIGLPGLSINWGAWATLGAAARKEVQPRMAQRGVESIEPEQGLKILGYLFAQPVTQTGVVPIVWEHFLRQIPGEFHAPFFSMIAPDHKAPDNIDRPLHNSIDVLSTLKGVDEAERFTALLDYISDAVAKTLKISSPEMSVRTPVVKLGIDSLMALELTNRLKKELGVDVPMVTFMEGVGLEDLARLLEKSLFESAIDHPVIPQRAKTSNQARKSAAAKSADGLLAELDLLSDNEVDRLLKEILSEEK